MEALIIVIVSLSWGMFVGARIPKRGQFVVAAVGGALIGLAVHLIFRS